MGMEGHQVSYSFDEDKKRLLCKRNEGDVPHLSSLRDGALVLRALIAFEQLKERTEDIGALEENFWRKIKEGGVDQIEDGVLDGVEVTIEQVDGAVEELLGVLLRQRHEWQLTGLLEGLLLV